MTSAEDLIAALERAPGIVIPLVRQANPAILERRPLSGKWSIQSMPATSPRFTRCSSSASN